MAGEGQFIDNLAIGDIVVTGSVEAGDGTILRATDTNYIKQYFNSEPASCAKLGAGAAVGAAGSENLMVLSDCVLEYHISGTQTILSPSLGTNGLNIGMDQTANDGVEVCCGINANCKGTFVVGTSEAFFAKMVFSIADVTGTDDCAFGFRKVAAYAAIDDYTDIAALNVISGDITIETIINNAATVATDTTLNWADTETHELKVLVSAAGVVTFEVDGSIPSTTAAFTFDDTDVVVPFLYFLNDTDLAEDVSLIEFECGLQ
jgi:hypothetical protein